MADKLTSQQKKDLERRLEDLTTEYTLKFTKQELIIIFNILVQTQWKIGDAHLMWDAVQRIQAIVAVDSNIPKVVTKGKES